MHEVLISGLIVCIVVIQIAVGLNTAKKIDLFKKILPEGSHFETVKVYIPESQIKDIKVGHILDNLDFYSSTNVQQQHSESLLDENVESKIDDVPEREEPMLEKEVGNDSEIWIGKDTEEKKIEFAFLKRYEVLGWKRIQ